MKKLLVYSLLILHSLVLARAGTPSAALDGVLIERETGGVLQFVLEGNRVCFHFFDDQMNPLPPDVDRITVRLQSSTEQQRFTVAIPYEGVDGLRAPLFIRPPHIFIAHLALMRDGSDQPIETYVADYPAAEAAD